MGSTRAHFPLQTQSPASRLRSFPTAVFLLALALRLGAVLATRHLGIGLDDMFQYDMLARSLAAGNGFRWYAPEDAAQLAPYLVLSPEELKIDRRGMLTTFRAPLYPGLISLVYMVFGTGPQRFFAVRLLQAILGAVLVPLTYLAGRLLLNDKGGREHAAERASQAAAIIIACYPMLVVYPLALATENLFFPLVLAATVLLLGFARVQAPVNGRIPGMLLASSAGLLLGLAALTRSVILPFGIVAAGWLWLALRRPRLAVAASLAMLVTIAPWIGRNSLVAGRPTGIETSMGYNLYLGYHPDSSGTFRFGPSLDLLSILDDQERDEAGTRGAIAFIMKQPERFPYLVLRRLGHTFDLEWRAFQYFYSNGLLGRLPASVLVLALALLAIPFAMISLGALFGAALLPRSPQAQLVGLLFLTYLLPHSLILSEERFHLLLVPLLAVLAAAAWFERHSMTHLGSRLWLPAAGACLLLFNWSMELLRDLPTLTLLLGPDGHHLRLPY